MKGENSKATSPVSGIHRLKEQKEKAKKNSFLASASFRKVIKYIAIALGLLALSNANIFTVRPFGAALFITLVLYNVNFFIVAFLFLGSEFIGGGIWGLASSGIIIAAIGLLVLIKSRSKRRQKQLTKWLWLVAPILSVVGIASLMPFTEVSIFNVGVFAIIAVIAVQAARIALKPILIEKLKYKLLEIDIICLAILILAVGMGLSYFNFFNFPISILVASFSIYITAKTAGPSKAIVVGILFGIGHAIQMFNPIIIAAYAIVGVLAVAFYSAPKILMPIAGISGYLIFRFFFLDDTSYFYMWVAAVAGGGLFFMFIPARVTKSIREYLFDSHEKIAVRYMIQRDREGLAKRLYMASNVFNSMSSTLATFDSPSPDFSGSLANKCCALCEHDNTCKRLKERDESLDIMLNKAFINGKALLSDVPEFLSSNCQNLAKLIAGVGSILEHRQTVLQGLDHEKNSRRIIASQMHGMGSVLSCLAKSTSEAVLLDTEREKALIEELNYASVATTQALIAKGVVTLILRTETLDRKTIEKIVSKINHAPYTISSIDDTLLAGFSCVNLSVRPVYDIIFGVAGVSKKPNQVSGDTHSFVKIGQTKFMMALSDGMGSGTKARKSSDTALGLVENFYRAGFSSEIVLKSVNRFLAGTGGDDFSALDVCTIDLNSLECDMVKLACPASFVKRDNMVRKIEGSNAPLGALENMEPACEKLKLETGDMIILASDGVSESFSGDKLSAAINNIHTKNPQTLATGILEYAMHNSCGGLKDDSTVLVARLMRSA